MQEPRFSFFPWKMLAFTMPVIAAGSAMLAFRQGKRQFEVISIFLAVLGAGNGYLLASAIGDLGRSLIAMIVGAAAGFLAVMAIQVQPLCALLLLTLAGFMLKNILSEYPNQPFRSCGCALAMGIVLLLCLPAMLNKHDSRGVGVFLLFPLVMCSVTSALPARRGFEGRLAAMNAGLIASFYGMLAWALGSFAAGVPAGLTASIFFRGTRMGDAFMIGAAVIGASIGNYVCIKILFSAATRVSAPAQSVPVAEEDSSETPP